VLEHLDGISSAREGDGQEDRAEVDGILHPDLGERFIEPDQVPDQEPGNDRQDVDQQQSGVGPDPQLREGLWLEPGLCWFRRFERRLESCGNGGRDRQLFDPPIAKQRCSVRREASRDRNRLRNHGIFEHAPAH
jgi:hypothetical protein